ncbi:FliH/SctL family protein [Roseospirillum parvum]|uniref:Flagellar assembly protein FliH n=1 Tax=Roseospirillum parvum TaxID=83401 RepID=A0A1G7W9D3_9PROT|nr:FliH/SctL family protein [Roseospirillum parvum]SDG68449.1 flagellar assembly protein FliH [Roseospirillum parvum]
MTRPVIAPSATAATPPDPHGSARPEKGAPVRRFLFDRRFDRPAEATPAADNEGSEETRPLYDLYDLGDEDPALPGVDQPPESADEPEETPPPPTYSAEELEEARAEAHARGRAEAFEEMATAIDRQAADALESVAQVLPEAVRQVRALTDTAVEQAAGVAAAIARKVLPASADQVMLDELKALLASVLPDLLEEPRLVVRVHESLAETVRQRLQPMAETAGFEGRLVVIGDTLTAPGDGRVEWAGGGVERRLDRLWAQIDTALSEHLGTHPDLTETPPAGPTLGQAAPAAQPQTAPTDAGPADAEPTNAEPADAGPVDDEPTTAPTPAAAAPAEPPPAGPDADADADADAGPDTDAGAKPETDSDPPSAR